MCPVRCPEAPKAVTQSALDLLEGARHGAPVVAGDPAPRGTALGLAAVPAGKALGAVLSFVATILLSRTLGAEGFGAYATAIALILLAGGVVVHPLDAATLRLVPALPAAALARAQEYLRAGFRLRLTGGTLMALALVAALPFGGAAFGVVLPLGHDWLLIGGVLAMVLSGGLSVSLQATHRFRDYVEVDLAANSLRLATLLALAAAGALDERLALTAWVGVSLTVFLAGLRLLPPTSFGAAPVARGTYAEILGYSRWIGLSTVLQLFVAKLDLVMTNAMAGGDAAGIYAAALNLAGVPELFASFLLAVTYPKVMPLKAAGTYRTLLLRFLAIAVPVAVAGALAAQAFAQPLVLSLYGPQYQGSVDVFRVLIAGTAVSFVVLPLAAPYLTLNLPRHLLAIEVVSLLAMVGGSWLLIPLWGPLGAATVAAAVRIGQGALVLAVVFRATRPGPIPAEARP